MRWDFKENKQRGDKIQDRTRVWLGQMSGERQVLRTVITWGGGWDEEGTPGDLSSVAHFLLS